MSSHSQPIGATGSVMSPLQSQGAQFEMDTDLDKLNSRDVSSLMSKELSSITHTNFHSRHADAKQVETNPKPLFLKTPQIQDSAQSKNSLLNLTQKYDEIEREINSRYPPLGAQVSDFSKPLAKAGPQRLGAKLSEDLLKTRPSLGSSTEVLPKKFPDTFLSQQISPISLKQAHPSSTTNQSSSQLHHSEFFFKYDALSKPNLAAEDRNNNFQSKMAQLPRATASLPPSDLASACQHGAWAAKSHAHASSEFVSELSQLKQDIFNMLSRYQVLL